jgi:hypothetical protein
MTQLFYENPHNFPSIFELHINVHKSGFVPIVIPPQHIGMITSILRGQPLQLPIIYLELPLTHKNPMKQLFDTMISTLERRLQNMNGQRPSITG